MRMAASQSIKALEAMTRDHTLLQSQLDTLHVAGRCREDVLRDFVERICTGYSGLMHMHATSCRNLLNAVLAKAQLKGEYVQGCPIRLSENGYSPCI